MKQPVSTIWAGGRSQGPESGQILLIVAAGIFFVALLASALAIDYGNGLLQRRRLQNAADAAALAAAQVLANGGTEADAVDTARSLVAADTQGAVSLPYPGIGAGAGLTNGIEVSSGDVRVALHRDVSTFFAPTLGVNTIGVTTRSRASVGPDGLLPIAVKRFSGGDTSAPLGTGGNPATVYDYMRPADNDTISSWPNPLSSPPATSAGFTSPASYNPAVSGRVFPILGQAAQSNVTGGNDFHNFIAPDVRDITFVVPTFYNGVTSSTSIQSLKDVESSYYYSGGYPGPNPVVGEQIAVLNGANVSQTVDAMRKAYRRGDVVAAMVYNGTVFRKPEFDLSIDAPVKNSSNIGPGGGPLTFQVTLTPRNGFSSSGVDFSATGLEGWADWQFNGGALNSSYSVGVSGSSVSVSFQVSATSVVQGIRTALIRAYDPASGNTRTLSATAVVGSTPSYSISCSEGYKVVEQGSSTRFDLGLSGWNGYPTTDVAVQSPQWYTNSLPPAPIPAPAGITVSTPSAVQVREGHSTNLRVDVAAGAGSALGDWLLKIPTTDGDPARNQSIYLNVHTILSGTGPSAGNTTSFVIVLGYVNLVVTYANNASSPSPSLDNNTIYGYVAGPMVSSPSNLGKGLAARVMGWNQSR